jgi:hypothetical protein
MSAKGKGHVLENTDGTRARPHSMANCVQTLVGLWRHALTNSPAQGCEPIAEHWQLSLNFACLVVPGDQASDIRDQWLEKCPSQVRQFSVKK